MALLTRNEYAAPAANMDFPAAAFIDGRYCEGSGKVLARIVRAGTVTVNCYGEGDITTPFGGYRQSGFGGRDNGLQAHDQYTECKTIRIDLSDPASADLVG